MAVSREQLIKVFERTRLGIMKDVVGGDKPLGKAKIVSFEAVRRNIMKMVVVTPKEEQPTHYETFSVELERIHAARTIPELEAKPSEKKEEFKPKQREFASPYHAQAGRYGYSYFVDRATNILVLEKRTEQLNRARSILHQISHLHNADLMQEVLLVLGVINTKISQSEKKGTWDPSVFVDLSLLEHKIRTQQKALPPAPDVVVAGKIDDLGELLAAQQDKHEDLLVQIRTAIGDPREKLTAAVAQLLETGKAMFEQKEVEITPEQQTRLKEIKAKIKPWKTFLPLWDLRLLDEEIAALPRARHLDMRLEDINHISEALLVMAKERQGRENKAYGLFVKKGFSDVAPKHAEILKALVDRIGKRQIANKSIKNDLKYLNKLYDLAVTLTNIEKGLLLDYFTDAPLDINFEKRTISLWKTWDARCEAWTPELSVKQRREQYSEAKKLSGAVTELEREILKEGLKRLGKDAWSAAYAKYQEQVRPSYDYYAGMSVYLNNLARDPMLAVVLLYILRIDFTARRFLPHKNQEKPEKHSSEYFIQKTDAIRDECYAKKYEFSHEELRELSHTVTKIQDELRKALEIQMRHMQKDGQKRARAAWKDIKELKKVLDARLNWPKIESKSRAKSKFEHKIKAKEFKYDEASAKAEEDELRQSIINNLSTGMNLELLKDHIKIYNPNHQGFVSKVLDDKMTRRQISRARYASLADRIQALDEPTRDTDILTKVYRAMDAMADVYTVKKLVEKAEAKANRLTKQSAPTTIPKQIPEKTPEEKIRESYGEKLSKEDEAELLEWIVKELKGGTPVERLKWTVKARYGPEYVRFVDKLTKKPSKASPKKKTPAKKPPAKKPVRKKALPKFKPENVKQHKGVKALSNEDLEWIYETLVRGRLTPGQLEGRVNVSFGPKYVYLVNMINKKWVGR